MKRFFFAIVAASALPAHALLDGELDRRTQYEIRRDYEQRREAARERMNAVADQGVSMAMAARQARIDALARIAQENPSFETELAVFQASRPPFPVSMNPAMWKQYYAFLRALHEKWGVQYDDTEERQTLSQVEENSGTGVVSQSPGCGKAPEDGRRNVSDVVEPMAMAALGQMLGERLAGRQSVDDTTGSILTEPVAVSPVPIVPVAPAVRAGSRHPTAPHVILSDIGEWIPEPGYDWCMPPERRTPDGEWQRFGAKWKPGIAHPDHPHVVAADREGAWAPEPGWRFASHRDDDWSVAPAEQ